MKDIIFDNFQNNINESLLRHKSILDIMTKYDESTARVNRAIAKAVTNCGCMKINASKQPLSNEIDFLSDLSNSLESHLQGSLCNSCRDIIEAEIGNNLFYLSALSNSLNLNLYDILIKENDKIDTLGKFTFR